MLSTMMVKGDELGWVLGDWFGDLNTGRWGCDYNILLPSYLPQAQQGRSLRFGHRPVAQL